MVHPNTHITADGVIDTLLIFASVLFFTIKQTLFNQMNPLHQKTQRSLFSVGITRFWVKFDAFVDFSECCAHSSSVRLQLSNKGKSMTKYGIRLSILCFG